MLRNFWKLQLNLNISSGNWYDFWYLNMIVELSAYNKRNCGSFCGKKWQRNGIYLKSNAQRMLSV